ncbi:MAG: AsmA family protein [Bacteroidetes bacterium]|nr:AsmA family protein [Bacteroidota bacterium]
MKKVLRILFITIGVILLLLFLIPVLFKSKIETTVKEKINESVYATVDWSRFSLSLFRGFPDLSINLHLVSVVGLEPFEGDTLVGLKRFEVRVNPFSAIRKDLQVKSVLLDHPLINGIVLEDGTANWDITEVVDEELIEVTEEEVGEGSSMAVSLEKFAIKNGRIFYNDAAMGAEAAMEVFNLELAGDFSMEETKLKLSISVHGIDVRYGGIRYMRGGSFGLDLLAAANMVENRYTMLKNEIRINGLTLGTEGVVLMMDDGGMDMDMRFFCRETSFQTLLSLVPSIYLNDFEALEAKGTLLLEGEVKGVMKDSLMPDALIKLEVTDGFFSYPDLPKDVSDVQLKLLANYNGKDMDLTTVDLEKFHISLGGNPFNARLHVDHPVSDMHVDGELKGLIDLGSLQDMVPMEELDLEGRMTVDVRVDTRMSYIEQENYEEVDLQGLLLVEGVQVETSDIPVPVQLSKLEMIFSPRYVDLTGVDLQMGRSDLRLEGSLSNFIPYVFKGETVSGALSVSSSLLDANELMPEITEEAISDDDNPEGEPADSLAIPAQVKIPENIDFALDLDMKEVIYDRIVIDNILGKVKVSEGVAELAGLELDLIGGSVTATGSVDTRDEYAGADLSLDMLGVDIPTAYSTFVAVERLAPMAKYCMGSANIKLDYKSQLDASFSPLYESVYANGQIFTKDLHVHNTKSFVRLSELLKNEKFREMAPDDMNIKFRIRDGKVIVDPFVMAFADSRMTISGLHGIDLSLDYLLDMEIAKTDLGTGARDMMNGVSALASSAGIAIPESDFVKIRAKITGTFSDPKISTDLSGNLEAGKSRVKEIVEERIIEEVEKVEEEVREEASEKADEIITEAEAEVERIMEDARKAGEDLVKEAEKQGENLMKEAGSNPLKKIAARKAADELVRQAKKQSENLLREAKLKADEVMETARGEAERI